MSMPDLFISSSQRDMKAVQFLNKLFWDAVQHGIQDVQFRFDAYAKQLLIQSVGEKVSTFLDYDPIEEDLMIDNINAKIRSRAHIDAADRTKAIDGKIRLIYREQDWGQHLELDIRLSIMPTAVGQTFVMRLQNGAQNLRSLEDLKTTDIVRYELTKMINQNQGIVVVCGPTGSGKTTLLFSLLLKLQAEGKNIKTIEHPPEYIVEGIDQVAYSRDMSFADAVRGFMRQRPHVILVGEVRDKETAEAVAHAGRTGHLVFCTVHADSSAEAFVRLKDLGMDTQTLCDSVKMIIAQRLVSTFDYEISEQELEKPNALMSYFLKSTSQFDEDDYFPIAPYSAMKNKGPLIEILKVTNQVKSVLRQLDFSMEDIFRAATKQPQFESLVENHVRLARQKQTTLEGVNHLPLYFYRRERVDQLLIEHGFLKRNQAYELLDFYTHKLKTGENTTLWELVLELNYVSLRDLINIYGQLESAEFRIEYFIERQLLSREEANHIINEWKTLNRSQSIFIIMEKHNHEPENIYQEAILYYSNQFLSAIE